MIAMILSSCLLLAQVGPPTPQPPAVGGDAAEEANALVERIQENLEAIDETLLSLVDADDPEGTLESVRQTHMEVIRDLEELIRQAKYKPSGSGGGGGGSPSQAPPEQDSGQDKDPRQSDGSDAPEPGDEQAPQPAGDEQSGQQPASAEPTGQDPADQLDDSAPAHNDRGGPPPAAELDDPLRENTDARWGLLPPKLQERLMNLHVDDVPARYRDWLAEYIRAMQRLEETDVR